MTLYTDIPTRAEIDALWNAGFPASVSLYVPTEPASSGEAEQIAFRNLARAALDQLAGADRNDLAAVEEALADLGEDDDFWRREARTLAVFATPAWLRTFRLPNRLTELAVGGERLYVKPLMRAVTFPQTAFVLALAQGGVRLLKTVPDAPPALVRVPDMPSDVASAVGKASIKDRAPIRRLQGSEGQKVRIRQYARRVDDALREVLPGQGVPLVIAATEPLDSIFRSVCRYPDVVPESVRGNPESVSDVELVQQARAVLDRYHAGQLAELHALFERRAGQNRTSSDIATVARLVTQGAVDTLFVDIDGVVPAAATSPPSCATPPDSRVPTGGRVGAMTTTVTADGRALVLADGNQIPLLALGVWQVPDGPECENAVRWALELGYRHIDTAQAYGNEASVGRALRDSGVPRDEVFLTTKFHPTRKDPEAEVQRSLERLGVDQVDLYIIHWPAGGPTWAWPGMERARERGFARSIGVSNFSLAETDRLLAEVTTPPVINQVQFSPFEFRRRLLQGCEERGVVLEAYSPLGTGRHLGDRRVGQLAERVGRTPAQVLLRWALQRNLVVLPKSTHRERIAENAGVFDFTLSPEDMATLDALDRTGGTDRAVEHTWW